MTFSDMAFGEITIGEMPCGEMTFGEMAFLVMPFVIIPRKNIYKGYQMNMYHNDQGEMTCHSYIFQNDIRGNDVR